MDLDTVVRFSSQKILAENEYIKYTHETRPQSNTADSLNVLMMQQITGRVLEMGLK